MASIPLAGQIIRSTDTFNLITFTPTFTNVTLGTGADNQGWYQQIGFMVMWGFRLEFGTSPAFVTGSAEIALPVPAFTGGGASLQACVGSYIYRTSGTSHYAGALGTFEAAGLNATFAGAWDSGTSIPNDRAGLVSATQRPAAPTAAGVLSGQGCYRAA